MKAFLSLAALFAAFLTVSAVAQQPVDLSSYTIVDLTHPYKDRKSVV